MNAKKKILFLCTHNAARSQMAEGFVKTIADRYEAYSVGNEPTEVLSARLSRQRLIALAPPRAGLASTR